jgi:hypothetical protein
MDVLTLAVRAFLYARWILAIFPLQLFQSHNNFDRIQLSQDSFSLTVDGLFYEDNDDEVAATILTFYYLDVLGL